MYRLLFRAFFIHLDPERAHGLAFGWIRLAARIPVFRTILSRRLAPPPSAVTTVAGVRFPAPFGLAAGFDKNAEGVAGLTMLGFGYVEVGTITARPQPGNDRPRLFRRPAEQALINRMGFNNEGADAVARRLAKLRSRTDGDLFVVGVNIGKTKVVPVPDAVADYVASATALAPYADYLVVNVSSPNTPGLRDLQAVESLTPLLIAVREAADDATGRHVPLFVKVAPDLTDHDIDAIADLVIELHLDGVVAVNTTIEHDGRDGPGGLSGAPLLPRGLDVVRRLRGRLDPSIAIIGVGGIFSATDAAAYLDAGADLVQGYTGFIYRGPFWASRINRALARRPGGMIHRNRG